MHKKHIPVLKHIISIFGILKKIPFFSDVFPCISFFIVYSNIVQGFLASIAAFVSRGNSSSLANLVLFQLKLCLNVFLLTALRFVGNGHF